MDAMRKCLVIAGMSVMWFFGILVTIRAARCTRRTSMYEKVGKAIEERLNESKATLDKTASQVRSVLEYIKTLKP
jgi:hypothetical protein